MKRFLAILLLAVMAACAQLGVQTPATFNQKALAAHNTVTAIANSATNLRAAGKLSDADKANIISTLKTAEDGIDLASMTFKTNPAAGADKLSAAIAVLTALNVYLATQGAK